jgi:hypothetical protein
MRLLTATVSGQCGNGVRAYERGKLAVKNIRCRDAVWRERKLYKHVRGLRSGEGSKS